MAALGWSLWLGYNQTRRRKSLGYEVTSLRRVVSHPHELRDDISITFQGIPVSNLDLLALTVVNTGRSPIRSEDFVEPFKFSFSDSTQILSAAVAGTEPDSLDPQLELKPSAIGLKPLLLNAGDKIELRFLLSNFDRQVAAGGRVVGVSKIGEVVLSKTRHLLFAIVGTASATVASLPHMAVKPLPEGWWVLAMFFGGWTLGLYGLTKYKFTRRLDLRNGRKAIPYDWDSFVLHPPREFE